MEVVTVTISANSFLHKMVRRIVGLLVGVGKHQLSPGAFHRILESGELNMQRLGCEPAPAHGLFLVDVLYDSTRIPSHLRGLGPGGVGENIFP